MSGRAKPKGVKTIATSELASRFLEELRLNGGIVGDACKTVGISRTTMYRKRVDDEEFAKEWDKAVDQGVDVLEDECRNRALNGTDKPVVFKGRITRTYKEKSDYCLGLVLRAHRAKYRVNTTEISGPAGEPIQTTILYLPDGAAKPT